jgi:hypothetical protein
MKEIVSLKSIWKIPRDIEGQFHPMKTVIITSSMILAPSAKGPKQAKTEV